MIKKCMALIDSCATFSTPEAIFLRDLLKPSKIPWTLQNVSVHFSNGWIKNEYGQKILKPLNLFKETPQTYPFIVGALPHYIGENAHIFANVIQPFKVILSFYKPQIWIFKAQISPKWPYYRLCRNI